MQSRRFETHYQHEGGFMERTRLLPDGTNRNGSGTVLVAGDFSQDVLSQVHNEEIQKDGLKISDTRAASKRHSRVRCGLPCANCKAYYASDLAACPICKCAERVPAREAEENSAKMFKPSGGVLQPALRSFVNLNSTAWWRQWRHLPVHRDPVHRDEDGKRFLLESKLLFCPNTDEINAGASSPCILDENHHTQHEFASVCLSCYGQLREKLACTEAALLMDLREAAQVIYEAVWADPSPLEPSRTYQNAAQALLNELRHRAHMVRLIGAIELQTDRSATLSTGGTGPEGEVS
jgi:hypothetical protein